MIGYFDSIAEMEQVYDQYAGSNGIAADESGWRMLREPSAAGTARLQRRLEWFQDQKFGLFLHWGIYSRLGCIESWPLVWADRKWSNPGIQTREQMTAFREKYWSQSRSFDPEAFDPGAWAQAAKRAGMKYVVFTTKHHDGFSMFDTRATDFRTTAPEVPFSRNARADIAGAVFRAFREQGFGIGAYFSKSDWHSPYYWSKERFPEDRNPNYDTAAEPERWAKFVSFVHQQVEELMTRYGRIDILWLDGGQVRPPKQDIQMDKLVAMARSHQPDLIVVNRTAKDAYEDYRTPEQEVPEKPLLDYPWESCITMGTQWSFKPNDSLRKRLWPSGSPRSGPADGSAPSPPACPSGYPASAGAPARRPATGYRCDRSASSALPPVGAQNSRTSPTLRLRRRVVVRIPVLREALLAPVIRAVPVRLGKICPDPESLFPECAKHRARDVRPRIPAERHFRRRNPEIRGPRVEHAEPVVVLGGEHHILIPARLAACAHAPGSNASGSKLRFCDQYFSRKAVICSRV